MKHIWRDVQYSKGTNISGYLVDYQVSETAMSTIYRVKHRALRSKHAMKFLQPQFAAIPSINAVYGKEMQILSNIRSPYLVRITEVINSKAGLGIVMDWMDGDTLETYLRKVGEVTPFFAAKWACQVLSALHLCHQNGLLHLGVCPHNIFLEKIEGGRVAVLMEHNIGRRMEQGEQKPTFNPASSYYCSPEQIDQPILLGVPSDIYAVGILLYRLTIGNVPFEGDTEYQVMHSIVSAKVSPFSDELDVPEGLEKVIRRAMNRDCSKRYQTIAEFIAALSVLFEEPLLDKNVSEELVLDTIEAKKAAELEFALEDKESIQEKEEQEVEKKQKYLKDIFQKNKQKGAIPEEDSKDKTKGKPKRKSKGKPKGKSKGKSKNKKSTNEPEESKEKKRIGISPAYVLFLALLAGVWLLSKGGLLGRETTISAIDQPSWGKVEAFLDGEKQPQTKRTQSKDGSDQRFREFSGKLEIGEHEFAQKGGVWDNGSCDRCCWDRKEEFSVPFGFGTYGQSFDFLGSEKIAGCPTLEQDFDFIEIDVGSFLMGTPRELFLRGHDEFMHVVQITHPFSISKHEVTQNLFQTVMGRNPSRHSGDDLPVDNVSWLDAISFCNELSEDEGLEKCYQIEGNKVAWITGFSCDGYRLPTESEWEYTAKATSIKYENINAQKKKLSGETTNLGSKKTRGEEYLYFGGKNPNLISWYGANSQRKTHSTGSKYPNEWGLYDMSGNVSEWTWDIYGSYPAEGVNPKGASSGRKRVIRGGNYSSTMRQIRVSTRDQGEVDLFTGYIGFRIVRSIED